MICPVRVAPFPPRSAALAPALALALLCGAGCAPPRATAAVAEAPARLAEEPPADSPFGEPLDPDTLRGREERSREIPADLDTRRLRRTRAGLFRVSLRSATPTPGLNRIHNWFVRVLDPAGRPVDGLALDFDGGMPAHGHGFPTQPRVTRGLGNGTYLVEGVKFNMSGWWEFVVRIDDGERTDDVRFNLVVAE